MRRSESWSGFQFRTRLLSSADLTSTNKCPRTLDLPAGTLDFPAGTSSPLANEQCPQTGGAQRMEVTTQFCLKMVSTC